MGEGFGTSMMNRHMRIVVLMAFVVSAWGGGAFADPPKRLSIDEVSEELKTSDQPTSATVNKILEQAVRNIARRYNLNGIQTEKTMELMKSEVSRFIRDHESEVWPAIRDLFSSGFGTKPPESQEEIKRIGKAARPLAMLAETAIYRANEEWRLILTDEQKKVHDFDMAEMKTTFEKIDQNLGSWEDGDPSGGPFFPQPKMNGPKPPRPSKPPKNHLPEPKIEDMFNAANIFKTLVEEFIKEYELDGGQVTSARSILEEYKAKASDFRDSNKLDFAKVALRHRQAYEARDVASIKEATADHKKLLEPVYQLCGAMDDRLNGLLTTAQIQRHAERSASAEPHKKTAPAVKSVLPVSEEDDKDPGGSDSDGDSGR